MSVRFTFGEAAVTDAVDRWHAGDAAETVLQDNARRRIVRIEGARGPLLVKQFRVTTGRHRFRERIKALLGRSPAAKEARALRRATARKAPVPQALALGALPDGDRVLVLPWIEADSVDEVLESADASGRMTALERLGAALHALHAAGFVHRDLHRGNVLFAADEVMLIDLQNARHSASRDARLRDLASLLFSLRGRIGARERAVLERAALGGEAEKSRNRLEAWLRERARDHGAGRTRRAMRPGRRFAKWQRASGSGLRQRSVSADALERWLAAHRDGTGSSLPIKREGRVSITRVEDEGGAVVIKETGAGPARALADLFRGSPGRRAWRAGHGLLARDVAAAEPLAFADRRTLGLPVASVVVLAAIDGPDGVGACGDPAALDAQLDLVARLHERAIDHGDLKATNWIHRASDGRAVLVDLEGVRFRRTLPDAKRIEGIAQWNASIPDEVRPETRRRLFDDYAERVPFSGDPTTARREIVRRSLARGHRWTGKGCEASVRVRRG